jgi:hypothetical protein
VSGKEKERRRGKGDRGAGEGRGMKKDFKKDSEKLVQCSSLTYFRCE